MHQNLFVIGRQKPNMTNLEIMHVLYMNWLNFQISMGTIAMDAFARTVLANPKKNR